MRGLQIYLLPIKKFLSLVNKGVRIRVARTPRNQGCALVHRWWFPPSLREENPRAGEGAAVGSLRRGGFCCHTNLRVGFY